jgi:ribosomal protein S18 acetylase RimI-like enzyme
MITIEKYKPEYQRYFEAFNKAWLEKYFVVEAIDEYVLTHPEEAILNDGGQILFAVYQNEVIGTVALRKVADGVMEFTKMAVDEKYQGLGAGKLLCEAAIALARDLKLQKLVLYSQTQLETAVGIYRKYGFEHKPIDSSKYKRADVYMEMDLLYES